MIKILNSSSFQKHPMSPSGGHSLRPSVARAGFGHTGHHLPVGPEDAEGKGPRVRERRGTCGPQLLGPAALPRPGGTGLGPRPPIIGLRESHVPPFLVRKPSSWDPRNYAFTGLRDGAATLGPPEGVVAEVLRARETKTGRFWVGSRRHHPAVSHLVSPPSPGRGEEANSEPWQPAERPLVLNSC